MVPTLSRLPEQARSHGILGVVGEKARLEVQIARIAARQHGNVTREQLIRLGMATSSIDRWVKLGRLHRIHRGVYAVGRPPVTPPERAAAAVLACGPRAALSHGSAMTLWGFWKRWETPFDVTVAVDRRPKGIRTHLAAGLLRRDVTVQLGIPVTSPARTLLDVAPRMPTKSLTRAVNDWRRSKLVSLEALADVAARFPLHPGAPLLAPHARVRRGPTRSGFEDDFLEFCRRFRLPTPQVNVTVAGYEVDAYFQAERLIVELDGWGFHSDHDSFKNDRERDATTLALGIATIRITSERLDDAPEREAARLDAILLARRQQAA
jgi:very-short-patch-repair endonuclease